MRLLVGAFVVLLILVGYGVVRTPASVTEANGYLGLIGLTGLWAAVLCAARWGPLSLRRAPVPAVRTGVVVGSSLGVLLAAENVAEYLTTVSTEASVRLCFALLIAMVVAFATAAALGAVQLGSVRAGVTAALWSVVAEYLIWYAVLLTSYYVFASSSELEHVLQAEGTYEDFRRSGMTDLAAFIMQDYLGAGFFHLLIGLVMAALFGGLAAGSIRLLARTVSRPKTSREPDGR